MEKNKKNLCPQSRRFCKALRRPGLLLLLAAVLGAGIPEAALANDQKVADEADLLTQKEEEQLQELYLELAQTYQCDVAVLTVDSCEGQTAQEFTDQYYYEQGYGYGTDLDGILLMVSIGDRQFHLATHGAAIDAFTDYGLEQIDLAITEDLSDGAYYEAFQTFGEMASSFLEEAQQGQPYDWDHTYKVPMSLGVRLLIMAIAGITAAGITFAALMAQLKSVKRRYRAQDYVRRGSFQLTASSDIFLYRTVTRRRIEKPQEPPHTGSGGSSTHSSPGGGQSGGRTGSF